MGNQAPLQVVVGTPDPNAKPSQWSNPVEMMLFSASGEPIDVTKSGVQQVSKYNKEDALIQVQGGGLQAPDYPDRVDFALERLSIVKVMFRAFFNNNDPAPRDSTLQLLVDGEVVPGYSSPGDVHFGSRTDTEEVVFSMPGVSTATAKDVGHASRTRNGYFNIVGTPFVWVMEEGDHSVEMQYDVATASGGGHLHDRLVVVEHFPIKATEFFDHSFV